MSTQKVLGTKKFTMDCPFCGSKARIKHTAIDQLGGRVRDHLCNADKSHSWRTLNGVISERQFLAGFSQKREDEREKRIRIIIELSSRSFGVAKSEINIPDSAATKLFNDLIRSGKIHRMCGSGAVQGRNARYFANKEDGDRFFSKIRSAQPVLKINYQKGPAFLEGEPDFSKAKITIAKSPDLPLRTNTHSPW